MFKFTLAHYNKFDAGVNSRMSGSDDGSGSGGCSVSIYTKNGGLNYNGFVYATNTLGLSLNQVLAPLGMNDVVANHFFLQTIFCFQEYQLKDIL